MINVLRFASSQSGQGDCARFIGFFFYKNDNSNFPFTHTLWTQPSYSNMKKSTYKIFHSFGNKFFSTTRLPNVRGLIQRFGTSVLYATPTRGGGGVFQFSLIVQLLMKKHGKRQTLFLYKYLFIKIIQEAFVYECIHRYLFLHMEGILMIIFQ